MSNLDQLSCKPLLSIWRYWQYQEYSHLSEEKKNNENFTKLLINTWFIHDCMLSFLRIFKNVIWCNKRQVEPFRWIPIQSQNLTANQLR